MKVGDKVRVINYGSLFWISKRNMEEHLELYETKDIYAEDKDFYYIDMMPEIIGKTGIITGISSSGRDFAIDGIKEKHAWYSANQLEIVI